MAKGYSYTSKEISVCIVVSRPCRLGRLILCIGAFWFWYSAYVIEGTALLLPYWFYFYKLAKFLIHLGYNFEPYLF